MHFYNLYLIKFVYLQMLLSMSYETINHKAKLS